MAFNIVDLVKDQIGDAVVDQLGGILGGSSDATSKAVNGAIPSILEGLVSKAGTTSGAESIFKAVQDQDDGILSNLGDLIGGGVDSPFASMGFTVLRSLLGNSMLGNIAGAIGGFSGLGRSSSSSLLGLVAPIVMSVIKRKVLGGGLNAASLASMLTGQRDNISAALPAGFADQIGSADLIDDVADTIKGGASAVGDAAASGASAVGNAAVETANAGGSLLGKILPLLVIGAALFFGLKMCGANNTTVEKAVVAPAPEAVVVEEAIVVEEAPAAPAQPVEVVAPVAAPVASTISNARYAITQNTAAGAVESMVTINSDGTGSISTAAGELPFEGATIDGNTIAFDVITSTPEGNVELNYMAVITGDTISGMINSVAGSSEFVGSAVQ